MQGSSPNDSLRRSLTEEAIERYVDWREASAAVRHTYERWSRASAEERALTFAAYRAALDQEESAATRYGALVDRALPRRLDVEPDVSTGSPVDT